MRLRSLLLVAFFPGALHAQSRASSLSTHVTASGSLAGAPVLLGASFATESRGVGIRLGAAVDAANHPEGESAAWAADLDGTASPGALVPALRDVRLFVGVGAHRGVANVAASPVVLSTSLGGGYRYGVLPNLAVEGELRYRVPLPEHMQPGFEVRVGLALHTGSPRRAPEVAVSRPVYLPDAAPSAAPALAVARRTIAAGESLLGTRYKWGGNSPQEGFDCSGFLRYIYLQHGVTLPRVSRDQANAGEPLPTDVSALRAGDLMFFATGGGAIDHVAMYVGDGRVLHSSSSGGGVRYDDLSSRRGEYLLSRFVAARRVIPDGAPPLRLGR